MFDMLFFGKIFGLDLTIDRTSVDAGVRALNIGLFDYVLIPDTAGEANLIRATHSRSVNQERRKYDHITSIDEERAELFGIVV